MVTQGWPYELVGLYHSVPLSMWDPQGKVPLLLKVEEEIPEARIPTALAARGMARPREAAARQVLILVLFIWLWYGGCLLCPLQPIAGCEGICCQSKPKPVG